MGYHPQLEARILPQTDDLSRGAQGVTDEHGTQQYEPAVKEVAKDALGRARRLADRDVAHEVGMRELNVPAGDRSAQLGVERESQAVACERLVKRGVARRERERGGIVEHLSGFEILEVGAADPNPLRRSQHGPSL